MSSADETWPKNPKPSNKGTRIYFGHQRQLVAIHRLSTRFALAKFVDCCFLGLFWLSFEVLSPSLFFYLEKLPCTTPKSQTHKSSLSLHCSIFSLCSPCCWLHPFVWYEVIYKENNFTESFALERTSWDDLVQIPAQAGSPQEVACPRGLWLLFFFTSLVQSWLLSLGLQLRP